MSYNIEFLLQLIDQASSPTDLFGADATIETVNKAYRRMAKNIHPDVLGQEGESVRKQAGEMFAKLNNLYNRAVAQLEGSVRGCNDTVNTAESKFTIRNVEYTMTEPLAEGDVSDVYLGYYGSEKKPMIVKIGFGENAADIRANNQLLKNESQMLKTLWKIDGLIAPQLPKLLEQFQTDDKRLANILTYSKGLDLEALRALPHYRKGVPAQHVAWIMTRVLSTLSVVHDQGITHNNINPSHIIVDPVPHYAALIDWCYSAKEGGAFRARDCDYSAPEVSKDGRPTPSTDIYSLGKSMVYLLGGNTDTGEMPSSVPGKFKKLLEWTMRDSVLQRPRDAYELKTYLQELREELWGQVGYLEFPV